MGARPIPAPEAVKDIGQILGRNTLAGIPHDDADAVLCRLRPRCDRPAGRGVAQRGGHQVAPHLLPPPPGPLHAHTYHYAHDLSIVCARIFTAFGPRQRPDLAIRKFAERMIADEPIPIFGDGSSLRDFTFVDDLVAGLLLSLDSDLGFEILNFGAGRTISVLDVVKVLERELGIQAKIDWQPPQTGDVRRTWADIGAAREAVGYAPAVPFEEGVRRFVAWLRDRES